MNVYDNAHQLARALKESSEYRTYKHLEKKVVANPDAKLMLEDFRKKHFEMQSAQMMGQYVGENKTRELQEMQQIIMQNPLIAEFMQTEFKLTQMLADIYKILGEALELDLEGLDR